MTDELKKLLYDYAMRFIGLPYHWGGDNPMDGFDCSGLVQEILKSAGLQPPTDMNAQMLHNHFLQHGAKSPAQFGALAFYGKSETEISHIAFCLDDLRMIEAGSGTSATVNAQIAARQGAYIRVRPIDRRKDLVAIVMPNYSI